MRKFFNCLYVIGISKLLKTQTNFLAYTYFFKATISSK